MARRQGDEVCCFQCAITSRAHEGYNQVNATCYCFGILITFPDFLHRRLAHIGGSDPNEEEHITVVFKAGSKIISSQVGGAWHVYTDR